MRIKLLNILTLKKRHFIFLTDLVKAVKKKLHVSSYRLIVFATNPLKEKKNPDFLKPKTVILIPHPRKKS